MTIYDQALFNTWNDDHRLSADRLPSVYIMKVPWFREDSFTTVGWVLSFVCQTHITASHLPHGYCLLSASVPSVTEISGMLHTSRPDNSSHVLLQLHTAPNCQYKVLHDPQPLTSWTSWLLFSSYFLNHPRSWNVAKPKHVLILSSGVGEDFVSLGPGTGAAIVLFV